MLNPKKDNVPQISKAGVDVTDTDETKNGAIILLPQTNQTNNRHEKSNQVIKIEGFNIQICIDNNTTGTLISESKTMYSLSLLSPTNTSIVAQLSHTSANYKTHFAITYIAIMKNAYCTIVAISRANAKPTQQHCIDHQQQQIFKECYNMLDTPSNDM
jgi:hypothetical protein